LGQEERQADGAVWRSPSLNLSHFRSHRAARLAFDGRPVAIVGPNGAGKTNILEAVSLLSPGRGLRRAAGEDLSRRPEALGWKVSANVQGLSAAHELETWAEPGEARQVRIDGKAATQASLGRVLRVLWLVPAMDRLWIEAAEGRRRFLDRMTLSFFPEHAEHSLSLRKGDARPQPTDQGSGERCTLVCSAGGADGRGRADDHGPSARAIARIATAADLASAFPTAELALTGPDGSDEPEDLASALAEGRRRDMAAGRTLVGPHRADLLARLCGQGHVRLTNARPASRRRF
jgi:DNA replication and repair protein RecF